MKTSLTFLISLLAVLGVVAASCGSSETATETVTRPAAEGEAGSSGSDADEASDTDASEDASGDATENDDTASVANSQQEVTFVEDNFDPEVACAEQFEFNPKTVEEDIRAIATNIINLFPELVPAGETAETLTQDSLIVKVASDMHLCQVTVAEIVELLESGTLGEEVRSLVTALNADSFTGFIEQYRSQACLVPVFTNSGYEVRSEHRLPRILVTIRDIALRVFMPTAAELEELAKALVTAISDAFSEGETLTDAEVEEYLQQLRDTCGYQIEVAA